MRAECAAFDRMRHVGIAHRTTTPQPRALICAPTFDARFFHGLDHRPEVPAHVDSECPPTAATQASRYVDAEEVEWREERRADRRKEPVAHLDAVRVGGERCRGRNAPKSTERER